MNEIEILKIAHETDPSFTAQTYYADILKFAKAIAAAEREACAKVCDEMEYPITAAYIRKRSNVEFSGQAAASSPRSSAGTQGYASEAEE